PEDIAASGSIPAPAVVPVESVTPVELPDVPEPHYPDELIEAELLAIADDDVPVRPAAPTASRPPVYQPPPPVAQQTVQAPRAVSPPPPPYQPPLRGALAPAAVPSIYEPEEARTLGRGLIVLAGMTIAVIVLIVFVVVGAGLLNSENDGGPTPTLPPPPTATATPEFRPSILIQAPANNTAIDLGDSVTIQFLATDRTGLTRVELLRFGRVLDSVSVGNLTSFQGSFAYTPDSTGTHTLEVVAYQGDVRGDPASVTLTVR
ncbi:MAG: hypothetical protein JW966_01325, partial [Anaerolineae bacterium]|nr:hypothetical protein [Anaerolineae bacterium]